MATVTKANSPAIAIANVVDEVMVQKETIKKRKLGWSHLKSVSQRM
jgi:hypothetical protein